MGSKPISSRKHQNMSDHVVVTTGPDVCLTPMGSSMVPVAYSCIAFMSEADRTASTVHNNRGNDVVLDTHIPWSTGMEPGTGKGVKSPGYRGPAAPTKGSSTVFSEGYAVIRDCDPWTLNMASSRGRAPQKGWDKPKNWKLNSEFAKT